MKLFLLIFLLNCSLFANANELFKQANVKNGEKLVSQNCISCHATSFGGDGSDIYTREFRKIKTPNGLVAQVRNCNTMLNLQWFEEDEINVAAYLNQTYYHFK